MDIEWPAEFEPAGVTLTAMSNSQVQRSPFTGAVHTLRRPGSRWRLTLRMAAMMREDALRLWGVLLQLDGMSNRLVYAPHNPAWNLSGVYTQRPLMAIRDTDEPEWVYIGIEDPGATAGEYGTAVPYAPPARPVPPVGYFISLAGRLFQVSEASTQSAEVRVKLWPDPSRYVPAVDNLIRGEQGVRLDPVAQGRFILTAPAALSTNPGPSWTSPITVNLEEDILPS